MNIPKRTTSQPKLDIETLKSIGKIKEAKLKSIPEVEKELDLLVTIEEQNDNDLSDVLQPTISKPHKKNLINLMKKKPDESDDELMFPFDDLDLTPSNKPISHDEEEEEKKDKPISHDEEEEEEEEKKEEKKGKKKELTLKEKELARKKQELKTQNAIADFIDDPFYSNFGRGYRNKKTKHSKKTKRSKKI